MVLACGISANHNLSHLSTSFYETRRTPVSISPLTLLDFPCLWLLPPSIMDAGCAKCDDDFKVVLVIFVIHLQATP